MIVRMGILQRPDHMTMEDFRKYWLEVHGPIASRIPKLRRYLQNHVINSDQLGISYPRGTQAIDGFSQLWFDDNASMKQSSTPDVINMLAKDEEQFIGNMQLIVAEQNEVIPVSDDGPLLKRMSLLKRRPDVDIEVFKREWREVHSELLKAMPSVKGYTQNLVMDRSMNREPAVYEDVPIDGIVELWFKDTVSLKASFASEAGKKAMEHAKTFIEEITTFIVETHEIVDDN
ncbi:hypothetical protein GCM10011409_33530 [Lentibacillus populi]|uniref:EthD domain-containing protein n=1 Tax=Lentibacillus populi TaxID=1827502 RepID=A0A9W5TZL1_9BACI|nr:EthD family reductase [Lentibacillus populi]GGB53246.1 hypothetical protein GCM10011409_33530 [Lentibacillus populi]